MVLLSMAGDIGVAHKSRGKAESGRIDDKVRSKVLELYHEKHWDFGPIFAIEKRYELDGIGISHASWVNDKH